MRPRLPASFGRALRVALALAIIASAAAFQTITDQPLQQSQASISPQQSSLRSVCVEPRFEAPRPALALGDHVATADRRDSDAAALHGASLSAAFPGLASVPLRVRRRVPRLGDGEPPWLG